MAMTFREGRKLFQVAPGKKARLKDYAAKLQLAGNDG